MVSTVGNDGKEMILEGSVIGQRFQAADNDDDDSDDADEDEHDSE